MIHDWMIMEGYKIEQDQSRYPHILYSVLNVGDCTRTIMVYTIVPAAALLFLFDSA
jgi:hypothetical protein